ncbi:MAG TPA: phytoene dehydrogenase, partial [Denitromonas sp.]|nr:phytoene dehydrogenase [Denitromonas sp.]
QTGGPAGLIAAVISARGPHLDLPKHEVELAIHNELEALLDRRLPPADSILTITEKRATFACRPQLARPGVKTAQRGVWLAGDYVEGPYPATIEGAVRAGVQCADTLMAANRRT